MNKRSELKGFEPTAAPETGDDVGFWSTEFMQHGDEASAAVTWMRRAQEIACRPFDRTRGQVLFSTVWTAEPRAVPLKKAEVQRLAQHLQFVQLPPGQQVIAQDEAGDYLLLVLEGSLAVERVQPLGERVRLAEAHPGDLLGEMSVLDAGARFSTCTTLTPCILAVLDAPALDELLHHQPRLALAVLAALSRRLSLRLRRVSARLSALLARG
jgi:CRP/FNR family transcriptional regulator, cyclic AMP receptor protein